MPGLPVAEIKLRAQHCAVCPKDAPVKEHARPREGLEPEAAESLSSKLFGDLPNATRSLLRV